MAQTAGDVLVETVARWGVDTIFGIPGDGINGVMEALRKRQDRIRFIQVRHEESAAFMACAYAKYTGRLGVCLATSGPGGIHLLNGLYDAKLDGQPVLAITGLQYHDLLDTWTQQDVALDKLFMDVSVYNTRVMGPEHVENVTELACRTALSYRGVAHITIASDIQEMEVKGSGSFRNVPHHTSSVYTRSARTPQLSDVQAAAELLNRGKRVTILAGRGALNAGSELEAVAERLGAPIVKALLGKACVPDSSPYTTNTIGLLGTAPSVDAMTGCDTLLMVGTSFPYIEYLPKPGQAKAVQIDLDPMRLGLRYPVDVALVGDCQKSLDALLPLLQRQEDRSFLADAQKGMQGWQKQLANQEANRSTPMKPQVIAGELGKQLDENAIVSCDSGTIAFWWARHIPVKRGQMHSVSGNLSTMACGLPYTIAAQIAYPERQCVAFVGDGGFSMLMAEFATCVKYKLPVKIVIIKNNSLGQIKWEQLVFNGNPEFGCDLHPIDFAAFARACGGSGFTIEDPKQCAKQVAQALAVPGPVIIDAVVDPLEPPMPAHIQGRQALHFAEALARGTKDASKIVGTIVQDKVKEWI